jgi:hypothetical protein
MKRYRSFQKNRFIAFDLISSYYFLTLVAFGFYDLCHKAGEKNQVFSPVGSLVMILHNYNMNRHSYPENSALFRFMARFYTGRPGSSVFL